jgi:hypothetical protein
MFARTGAPKPIEASCRLGKKRQFWSIKLSKLWQTNSINIHHLENEIYRSEMVFSKFTNAPPHMKRMSFVSTCHHKNWAIRCTR